MRALVMTLLVLALPSAALAHDGVGHDIHAATGFVSGFSHPFGGLDHVLAMLAAGTFAAVLGRGALLLVPVAFLATMLLGFGLSSAGPQFAFVEIGIALSVVVIGGAAALGRSTPLAAAMALVGCFALFHGLAHGAEMPAGMSGFQFAAGFAVATSLLLSAGLLVTLGLARLAGAWARRVARFAGAALALVGGGMLAGWL